MHVVLIGAELEENLGLRYMASALEERHTRLRFYPSMKRGKSRKWQAKRSRFAPILWDFPWCSPEGRGSSAASPQLLESAVSQAT